MTLWLRRLVVRWQTRRALRRLARRGIRPTMTSDALMALTRDRGQP